MKIRALTHQEARLLAEKLREYKQVRESMQRGNMLANSQTRRTQQVAELLKTLEGLLASEESVQLGRLDGEKIHILEVAVANQEELQSVQAALRHSSW